jgi:hypothetical protein
MSSEQAKRLAHELTIEYLRANSGYLKDVRENIPPNGRSNCRRK